MYKKLVDICGYEFPTNLQNFTQKYLSEVKNIPKSFEGLFFGTPCRLSKVKVTGGYRVTFAGLVLASFSTTLCEKVF